MANIEQSEIEFGDVVEDRITGFSGVVERIGFHISGCSRVEVRPISDDDKRDDSEWFYEGNLEVKDKSDEFQKDKENAVTSVDFDLGDEVKDKVTGFTGVVTVVTFELFNCPQVHISPNQESDVDSPNEDLWVDAPRVKKVNTGLIDRFTGKSEQETGCLDRDVGDMEDVGR